jgi:RND superfamily putative drug exporter
VARGTTGAPRHGQTADDQGDQEPPASRGGAPVRFVTGRKTKYVVVLFWLVLVAVTGSLAGEPRIFNGIDSALVYASLGVVIGLLLLRYRSPVLWLPPIISAGVALVAAEAVICLLTEHAGLTVNGQGEGILVVLVIGASAVYALLLIARYRDELRQHADRHVAMAVALRRSGPAIIASGMTVAAGMLCLLAAASDDISGLVPVAAIGIAVGLIAMVTLLPALLVVSGRWIFWPARPGLGTGSAVLGTSLTVRTGRRIWWPSSLSRPAAVAGPGSAAT